MKPLRTLLTLALVALLVGSSYAWWRTGSERRPADAAAGRALVDASALETARRLLPLAAAGE